VFVIVLNLAVAVRGGCMHAGCKVGRRRHHDQTQRCCSSPLRVGCTPLQCGWEIRHAGCIYNPIAACIVCRPHAHSDGTCLEFVYRAAVVLCAFLGACLVHAWCACTVSTYRDGHSIFQSLLGMGRTCKSRKPSDVLTDRCMKTFVYI